MEFIKLKQIPLEEFEINVLTDLSLKEKSRELSLRKKHWLYLLKNNLLTCPVTNKKVSYCSYDVCVYNQKIKPSFHYNFYSEDGELFSIDHKIPISKGGSKTDFSNIQPMTIKENWEKSNQLIYT